MNVTRRDAQFVPLPTNVHRHDCRCKSALTSPNPHRLPKECVVTATYMAREHHSQSLQCAGMRSSPQADVSLPRGLDAPMLRKALRAAPFHRSSSPPLPDPQGIPWSSVGRCGGIPRQRVLFHAARTYRWEQQFFDTNPAMHMDSRRAAWV